MHLRPPDHQLPVPHFPYTPPVRSLLDGLPPAFNAIPVGHRPDHGTASKAVLPKDKDATAGRLHNDTAYGLTGESDTRGNSIVVHRVPLAALKKPADIDRVRDTVLKAALHRFTKGLDRKSVV